MLQVFNMCTDVSACNCTWGAVRESAVKVDWKKNPSLLRGIERQRHASLSYNPALNGDNFDQILKSYWCWKDETESCVILTYFDYLVQTSGAAQAYMYVWT